MFPGQRRPQSWAYSRECLLSFRLTARVPLTAETAMCVQQLGLRRHRGRRAGRRSRQRPVPCLRPAGNGAFVVTGNRPSTSTHRHRRRDSPCLIKVPVLRHTEARCRNIVFGSMNIRSLSPIKLDHLLVEFRDRSLMLCCSV